MHNIFNIVIVILITDFNKHKNKATDTIKY